MSTRCSTARGPARSPSLVTWPTRRSGTPVDLAMRVRRSTQVRTWARLPAGWPSSGSETDWSESTTTRAGRCRSTAASIASTSGPSMARRFGGTGPMREARPRTWASDSSAEASMTSSPVGRQGRQHLEEQRRLADAGRAEQQGDRAGHHAAAHDPVELADPGRERVHGVGRHVGQGQCRAAPRRPHAETGRCRSGPVRDPACSTRRRLGSVRPSAATSPRTRRRGTLPPGRASAEPWPCRHPTGAVSHPSGTFAAGARRWQAASVTRDHPPRRRRRSTNRSWPSWPRPSPTAADATPPKRWRSCATPGRSRPGAAPSSNSWRKRGGSLVGHLQAAPGRLDGTECAVAGVAPVCVATPHQRRGIGSALMATLLRRATARRWPLLVLLGDRAYYGRFGFEPAGALGLVYAPVGRGQPALPGAAAPRLHGGAARGVQLLLGVTATSQHRKHRKTKRGRSGINPSGLSSLQSVTPDGGV